MRHRLLIILTALLLGSLVAPELVLAQETEEQAAEPEGSRPERARRERRPRGETPAEGTAQPSSEDVARQVITGEIHQSATGGSRQASSPSGQQTRQAAPSVTGSQADPDMAVLFFRPPSISVTEGEEFSTELVLSNPRNLLFDRASLTLLFNSAALELIDQQSGSATMDGAQVECGIDEGTGYLRLACTWERPIDLRLAHIITFVWRARREVRTTDVSFLSEGAGETFVGLMGGGSIIGNATREAPGLIAASVRISPDLGVFLPESSLTEDQPWIDPSQEPAEEESGVTLTLAPRVDHVARGEVFDVDVVISNPSGRSADTVGFTVIFDHEALEVIDTHEGNWIEQGVNIWDGGYHGLYPFDLHVANRVNNDRGLIDYRMGFSEEMPLPSGTVATIRFHALRPSSSAEIEFDPDGTSVRFLGEEIAGEDDLVGLSLPIDSRPAARATGAEGPIS